MRQRILIVEDSVTQAEELRLLLEGAGYAVAVARNGRAGLAAVQAAVPDLIISDVMMPEMDGYALCQAIKGDPQTRRIPFVLLTERKDPPDVIEGMLRGADNFLTKPIQGEQLLERIRRIFEHLELRKHQPLEMEIHLRVGGRQLAFNADKQQIIELLFATFEELSQANQALRRHEETLERRGQELALANRRLAAASAAKSEFLANMSHELRTPLNGILGFAQLLLEREGSLPSDRERRYAQNIHQSGEHLLRLINDILDLSRVEAGKIALHQEWIRLETVLEEILVVIRGLAHRKSQTVEVELDRELPRIWADSVRIKQACFNLLGNAVKFTPPGGRVRVTARAISDLQFSICDLKGGEAEPQSQIANRNSQIVPCVEIAVSDTGAGIRPEDLPRLFQEFVQLETTQDQRHEGTGLGLALTRKLVELHGGTIQAVSAGEGQGATFTIRLPAGDRPGNPPPPGTGTGGGRR